MISKQDVSIAILGGGLIGETHAKCLADLGIPPTLFCDSDEAKVKRLAGQYGAKWTTDPMSAINHENVSAVYICTYHDTHTPFAIAAAQTGKDIFLEKPMALTESDCRAITDAVEEHDVLCMTGFKFHYYSLVQKAKTLVPNPLVLSAQVLDRRWPDDSWANDPIKGGGNVLSQGCHAVELLCNLANSRPIRVYAEGGNLHHPHNNVTDSLAATIAFENGAIATITISDAGETPRDSKFSIQALDGEKTVHLYDRLTRLSYFDGMESASFDGFEDGFLNENKEFLDALQSRRTPETSELDGYRTQMILLRAIESMRTHEAQSLEDLW